MNIKICDDNYTIDEKIDNLLDILHYIKQHHNQSLTYRYSCKSGICGSCAVRVNGVEKLACLTNIKEQSEILPLKNLPIIKDLVVNNTNIPSNLTKSAAYLEQLSSENNITQEDIEKIDINSNCILCNSCYSSCPVLEINQDFIGPFALARVYRYTTDKKETTYSTKLNSIQTNGVWDCTLCGACDLVCPANIPIKDSIIALQNLSVQNGYENPAFSSNSFDMGFQSDFGFDPNSF